MYGIQALLNTKYINLSIEQNKLNFSENYAVSSLHHKSKLERGEKISENCVYQNKHKN